MEAGNFLRQLETTASLATREEALRVGRAVICALRERLHPDEVEPLFEAFRDLPELFDCARADHRHAAPGRAKERLTEPELAERVRDEGGLEDLTRARTVIRHVLAEVSSRLGGADEAGEKERSTRNVVRKLGRLGPGGGSDEDE